jgi:signal transduction histidine kinase
VFGWSLLMDAGIRLEMALLGTVYLAISTVGWVWADVRGPRAIAALLGALTAATLVALWLTHLGAMLLAMAMIGFTAIYGGVVWGLASTLVFFGFAVAAMKYWGGGPIEVYARTTGMLPGAVFTVLAGVLVARERDARAQIRRYAAQVEELATTRERNRIAREIHDSVGHYLTVVNVQIEAARAVVARDPAASDECLLRAQELAREGLTELRRSVAMLRAGALETRPFGVALAQLVDESGRSGLEVELEVEGTPRPLTPAVEFTLFRGAQEALTNVTRHASAKRASVALRYGEREVALAIADDGVGAVSTDGGFGLVGLRERAALVGGSVEIATGPGRGFTLEVRVPT